MARPISSAALADGRTLSISLAGPEIFQSGLAVAHANRSRRPDAALAPPTSGTSGPSGSSSSRSVDLQSFLASKCRRQADSNGSMLFKLTFKERATPSGFQICAVRGSRRLTSDSACTSRPSPTVNDSKGSDYTYANGDHNRICLKLPGAAKLASWATPAAQEAGGTVEQFLARKEKANENGSSLGVSLTSLSLQAQLASGTAPTGSTAPTESIGQLNPELPRWLQGYPAEWGSYADTATRSRSK